LLQGNIIFMRQLLVVFCITFFSLSHVLNAQTSSVSQLQETGIWNGAYLKVKLTDKIGYYGEHHYRTRNSLDNLYSFVGRTRQSYNRAGINIFFSENFEAVIGPTLVFNYTPDPGNPAFEKVTLEPRIWHQWLLIMPPIGRVKVYHQFRFEHRWKRDNRVDAEFAYTNRYRYKIFTYIPLNNTKIKEKTFFFSPSVEIFMHSGKSIVYNPFEDFRTYNGFGYVYNQNITFFAGHMWTFGQRPSGFEYATSHILRFNIFIGIDGRRLEDRLPNINIGY
jgi:hypothetical protein